MTFRNFVPEIWSANVDVALRNTLVYGGPAVCNREYEGEIANQGDTVKVTSVGRPTIGDYVPGPGGTTIVPEPINTGQRVFQVDQAKYWSIGVDDIDKAQAKSDLMPAAMDEAGYAMAEVVDKYVASLHTQIPASQSIGTVSIDLNAPTAGLQVESERVYDELLIPLGIRLDEMNVPDEGRYAVLPPWLYGCIKRDKRFIEAMRSGNASALRTGQMGVADRFTIYKSNNVPVPTANNFVVTAGTSRAITFASQVTEMEPFRPQSSFSDAIKSLYVYGAKVFRSDCIVKAVAVRNLT